LATAVNAQLLQLDDERQQLEKLLQQVTSQLNAIGSLINGEVIDRGAARQSRADLDARVRSEIRDLDQQITQLDDLSEVRRTAQTHISAIDDHLQVFEAREQTRDESAGERNEGMRERIQELERETTALQSALLREQKLALTDALTRIPNRLAYQERVKQDFQRWKRFRRPLVLLVWDIDHFKAINDTYGHPAGDKVLQLVAQLFKRQLRATDFVCRQGGEEFVMLLDGAADDMALQLANRMREAIGGMGFHCRGAPVAVTISCGLTSFQESDTPESVFQRADKLLYKAKHSGRNRCELG
jgi:diguanylate cyclase